MNDKKQAKPSITRIDFALTGAESVIVNKIDDLSAAGRAIVVESNPKPASEFEKMVKWCEENGWTVRRFLPLGARAWKGEPRPVRDSSSIRRKRDDLTRYPIPGLNVVALDLAYDC